MRYSSQEQYLQKDMNIFGFLFELDDGNGIVVSSKLSVLLYGFMSDIWTRLKFGFLRLYNVTEVVLLYAQYNITLLSFCKSLPFVIKPTAL